ncbi:hypothetical protein [Bacillus cereus group sp. TH152-1LC]|uniref:hypothetical protein n=1 Tax=Bacillus cereus group sp. TH152-1LC TaxID=3018060 RepID=UPI0022E04648|nr:hypothetical protein [Bacillus cereus group sp. TH152-1LC]MDA1675158.1 hypothetical protein [Bacillus cereus group sp. TH152-1LC]
MELKLIQKNFRKRIQPQQIRFMKQDEEFSFVVGLKSDRYCEVSYVVDNNVLVCRKFINNYKMDKHHSRTAIEYLLWLSENKGYDGIIFDKTEYVFEKDSLVMLGLCIRDKLYNYGKEEHEKNENWLPNKVNLKLKSGSYFVDFRDGLYRKELQCFNALMDLITNTVREQPGTNFNYLPKYYANEFNYYYRGHTGKLTMTRDDSKVILSDIDSLEFKAEPESVESLAKEFERFLEAAYMSAKTKALFETPRKNFDVALLEIEPLQKSENLDLILNYLLDNNEEPVDIDSRIMKEKPFFMEERGMFYLEVLGYPIIIDNEMQFHFYRKEELNETRNRFKKLVIESYEKYLDSKWND